MIISHGLDPPPLSLPRRHKIHVFSLVSQLCRRGRLYLKNSARTISSPGWSAAACLPRVLPPWEAPWYPTIVLQWPRVVSQVPAVPALANRCHVVEEHLRDVVFAEVKFLSGCPAFPPFLSLTWVCRRSTPVHQEAGHLILQGNAAQEGQQRQAKGASGAKARGGRSGVQARLGEASGVFCHRGRE